MNVDPVAGSGAVSSPRAGDFSQVIKQHAFERLGALDERRDRQLAEERFRQERFRERGSGLGRLPLAGPMARVLYGQKPSRLLALLAILVAFTLLKAPHLDRSFTGVHSLKYNSYVEPAMYMADHNDPLRHQRPYQADPENPEGLFATFGHLPLMEWGLYLTFEGLPFDDIELETRLFTHLVGLGILVLGYFFFRRWVPNELALLTILVAAFNPIVAFSTYVTVNDSLLIFWMFVSLLLMNRYLDSGELRHLYLAGIAGGVGVAVKLSLFLWLVPIVAVFLLTERVPLHRRVASTLFFAVSALLPLLAVRTAVTGLPGAPVTSGLLTLAWVIVLWILYAAFASAEERIRLAIRRAAQVPWLGWTILAGVGSLGVFLFVKLRFTRYAPQFLTDLDLLFEPRFYLYMASEQFRDYLTPPVTYLAGAGALLFFLGKRSDARRVFLALVVGSLVYWVVASKAMFFHNYYTLILMITASFAAAAVAYAILARLPRPSEKVVVALLGAAVFLRPAQRAADELLGLEEDISPLVEFVRANTSSRDLLLHEGYYSALGIYTRRPLVRAYRLTTPSVRQDIASRGFEATMRDRGIKYLITPFDHPSYRDFAPVFDTTSLREPAYNRNYNICRTVNLDCPELADDYEKLDRIVARHDIPSKFRLVTQVGKFKIYSFDGPEAVSSAETASAQ